MGVAPTAVLLRNAIIDVACAQTSVPFRLKDPVYKKLCALT